MLIPTTMQRLPSEIGCYNGQLLFGGAVSQMASALAQLTRVKFLGEAHYYVGREVGSVQGGRSWLIETGAFKGATTSNYLYQSTPMSSHLGLIIQYTSANFEFAGNTNVEIKLRATGSNSYTGTVLDYGCKFTEVDLESDPNDALTAFTGTELISAPSNTLPEAPRPLFVPSANRGELLNIAVTTNNLVILGLHIYDLLDPEVTP